MVKKTIRCEGCFISYTYNATEEDAETVRKCRDCKRKSFRQVLESRTPNGTPGGTPVGSPEKRAPRSPTKTAAAKKDVVGVQCFKCQAWFESADDAYLIHVGECDAEVNHVE